MRTSRSCDEGFRATRSATTISSPTRSHRFFVTHSSLTPSRARARHTACASPLGAGAEEPPARVHPSPPFAWQVAEEHRPAVERQADERHR